MKRITKTISIVAVTLLMAAVSVSAVEEFKIVYNAGVPPLKFENAAGEPTGLLPDLWRLWSEKTGQKVRFVKADSFAESLQMLKKGQADLHVGLFKTKEREQFLTYSEPILKVDYHIFTHPTVQPTNSFEDLSGLVIGVPRGGYTEQLVRSKFPEKFINVYDDSDALFRAALKGEVKAFVNTRVGLFYYLNQNRLFNIFGYVKKEPIYSQIYYTATAKKNQGRIQAVNQGLLTIDDAERTQLEDNWIVRRSKTIPAEFLSVLTEKERIFLSKAGVIRIQNESDWAPFNFNEDGHPKGYAVEFMRLLSEKTGLEIEFVHGPTWDEFMQMIKTGTLDVIINIAVTPERKTFLVFTKPYLSMMQMLYTRKDFPMVSSIEDLYGKRFAVPKGFYLEETLKNYPQIEVVPVDNATEAILAVSTGKADAAYDLMPVMNYIMEQLQITNLKVGGEIDIVKQRLIPIHMAMRKDQAILASILNKGMDRITDEERRALQRKWLGKMEVDTESYAEKPSITMTAAEKTFIASHKPLVFSEVNWKPLAITDDPEKFDGMIADYLEVITERSGLKFAFEKSDAWGEVLQKYVDQKIDVIPALDANDAVGRKILLSSPYVTFPLVIVTRNDVSYIAKTAELNGKAVAVGRGYTSYNFLKNNYGQIKLVEVDNVKQALIKVANGEVFAFVGHMAVAIDNLQRLGMENLKIAGETEYRFDHRIGVDPKYPEAVSIINKVLASMNEEDHRAIYRKWLHVEYAKGIDYSLIWKIVMGSILLMVVILFWVRKLSALNVKLNAEVAERKAQEDRSRLLLESVGEGIFGVDTKGRVTFINPTALNILGYMEQELVGKKIHDIIHHSYPGGSPYPVEKCFMFASYAHGDSHHVDNELLWRKDGTNFPVEYSSTPMEKDGSIVGAVITFRDITERKTAEERFAALLESAPDAMVVSDETGDIVLVNSQTEKIFGYSREDLVGKKIEMLVPAEIREVHPDYRARFYADPQRLSMGFRGDFYGVTKDGQKIPMDIGLSPIKTDKGLLVVASLRDITERKRMEEALDAERERLQGILDASPVGVAISVEGIMQFVNPQMTQLFGMNPGDSILQIYVDIEDRNRIIAELKMNKILKDYELQVFGENGEVLDIMATYILTDMNGKEAILCWWTNITQLKRTEREIQEKYDELARFRRMAIGREQKMIELKKEINKLLLENGLSEKYKIHG